MVEFGVSLRVERREREVFELLFDLLDPESVRQRGVDVERFLGDPALLLRRHAAQRAHVVEAVGELDQQHPQVLGHRHEHLAHRRCLLCLARVEPDSFELGDAIDDPGDLVAEVLLDIGEFDLGVLHGVVEECGGDRDLVEADVGHDLGNRKRMVDVALAARPGLGPMRLGCHVVGTVDHIDARLGVMGSIARQERSQLVGGGSFVVTAPRQDTIDGCHAADLSRS